MAVDKARHHHVAARREDRDPRSLQLVDPWLSHRSDVSDHIAVPCNRLVQGEAEARLTATGASGGGDELADIGEQSAGRGHHSPIGMWSPRSLATSLARS